MKKNEQFVNEDTYQTLKELKVDPPPHEKAITAFMENTRNKTKLKLLFYYVATPVHSDCSIHYTQALLEFQNTA